MIDLSSLPTSPGVYIYKNNAGEIIYVGKAINLKKRVSQYFQRDDALGPKTKTLVSQIATIDTKVVSSEIEALILESSLIKKHLPKYNSLLRDDRSYQYIVITKDKLPLIYSAHTANLPKKADIYGPFPSGRDVTNLLKTIRHIFPFFTKKHQKTPCLFCHLHLCPGPNITPKEYKQNILKIKKILNGKFSLLKRNLKKEMTEFSRHQNFEAALMVKNQIDSLDYVVSGWKNLNSLFASIELSSDRQNQSLSELKTILKPYLKIKNLHRLECFDISQLGSKYFVGSMSVAIDGKPDSSQYRQFKINGVIASRNRRSNLHRVEALQADDQLMIAEVICRRLHHPEWGSPDLIIVDGGKPQVSSALKVTGLPLIGLAKKFETIVLKTAPGWQEINLPPNSSALLLLQNLRNEAHRFANRYRKKLISFS